MSFYLAERKGALMPMTFSSLQKKKTDAQDFRGKPDAQGVFSEKREFDAHDLFPVWR